MNVEAESTDPNRRAVLRVAAWSVPVVTVAAVAPLAAATVTVWDIQNLTDGLPGPGDDTFPITLAVTANGLPAPDGTQVTATLLGAAGIATFEDAVTPDGSIAIGTVEDGVVIFTTNVLGSGTFNLLAAIEQYGKELQFVFP